MKAGNALEWKWWKRRGATNKNCEQMGKLRKGKDEAERRWERRQDGHLVQGRAGF